MRTRLTGLAFLSHTHPHRSYSLSFYYYCLCLSFAHPLSFLCMLCMFMSIHECIYVHVCVVGEFQIIVKTAEIRDVPVVTCTAHARHLHVMRLRGEEFLRSSASRNIRVLTCACVLCREWSSSLLWDWPATSLAMANQDKSPLLLSFLFECHVVMEGNRQCGCFGHAYWNFVRRFKTRVYQSEDGGSTCMHTHTHSNSGSCLL